MLTPVKGECPSALELLEYSRGKPGAERTHQIEQHLPQCTACLEVLQNLRQMVEDSMLMNMLDTSRENTNQPLPEQPGSPAVFKKEQRQAGPVPVHVGQLWSTIISTGDLQGPVYPTLKHPRIVVILQDKPALPNSGQAALVVAPISLETDFRSRYDLLISQEESQLGYNYMIEVWNQTPMLKEQLGRYLGTLTEPAKGALEEVYRAYSGRRGPPSALAERLGPAIPSPIDRVVFFQDEEQRSCNYLRRPFFALLEQQITNPDIPNKQQFRASAARWLESFHTSLYKYLLTKRFAQPPLQEERARDKTPAGYNQLLGKIQVRQQVETFFYEPPDNQKSTFIRDIQRIAYFKAALQTTPPPEDEHYARLQSALGAALHQEAIAEKPLQNYLEEAIQCYHEALRIYTPETFPAEHSEIQSRLGMAYLDLSQEDLTRNVVQALDAFEKAASVSTHQASPLPIVGAPNYVVAGFLERPDRENVPLEYLELELEIKAGNKAEYSVVARLRTEQADEIATSTVQKSHLLELSLVPQTPRSSEHHRPAQERQAFQNFGQGLFKSVFNEAIQTLFDTNLERSRKQGKGLRLRLFAQSPELADLPWEYLYDTRQSTYLLLSPSFSLVHSIDPPQTFQPLPIKPPLRVLCLIGDQDISEWQDEQESISDALKPMEQEGLLTLTWIKDYTRHDLEQTLTRGGPWHVFHFLGHSTFDLIDREEALVLTSDEGRPEELSASALGRLLVNHGFLRLALLSLQVDNGASSNKPSSSIATALHERGIPAIVSLPREVIEQSTVAGIHAFYHSLTHGASVDAALQEWRIASRQEDDNTGNWGKPRLHLAAHGNLFYMMDLRQQGGYIDANRSPQNRRPPGKR